VAGCCVCGNEHLGSIEYGDFMAAEEMFVSEKGLFSTELVI
jgi:hypothetical protein